MRLKIFRAPSLNGAMAQVRAELGADALILGTRRSGGVFEITAALEPASVQPDPVRAERLRWHGVPAALAEELAMGEAEQALAARFRFGALDLGPGGPPLLLAGPPGAGKTLTVARLATRLRLAGLQPLVVSTDSQRAGAAEQLAAFTRLLGLTLLAAPDPVSLARVLGRRQDGAPVLIDTGGIDPFDAPAQAGVAALAAVARANTALVLPAGGDAAESADVAAAFAAAGATALVATRLDVVRRLGGILAAGAAGLVLAEAGTGPDAADGLQALSAAFLAQRLHPAAPGPRGDCGRDHGREDPGRDPGHDPGHDPRPARHPHAPAWPAAPARAAGTP